MSKEKAQELKAEGNRHYSSKDYDQAILFQTDAINNDSDDHTLFSNRSACYASKNDQANAFSDACSCIQLKPDWGRGQSRKAVAEYHLNKLEDCIETQEQGLKLDPENQSMKEGLNQAKQKLQQSRTQQNPFASMLQNPANIQKLMNNPKTAAYMKDPQFMQMFQMCVQNPNMMSGMMQSDPRFMEVLSVLLGIDNMSQDTDVPKKEESSSSNIFDEEKPAYSSNIFSDNTDKKPSSSKPTSNLPSEQQQANDKKNEGTIAYKAKKFEDALKLYQEAFDYQPKDPTPLANKAAVQLEMKEPEKCLETCKIAKNVADENFSDYAIKARIYQRMGNGFLALQQYDEAIDAFEDSLLEKKTDAVKDLLYKAKKSKKKQDEEKQLDPVLAEELKNEGNILFKDHDQPAAIKKYEEAIKRNPKVPAQYTNKAGCQIKKCEYPTAQIDINKALSLDNNWPKGLLQKAQCHFFMKEYHKSIECYQNALKVPDLADNQKQQLSVGLQQVQMQVQISMQSSDVQDEERVKHAMADPEIQKILSDPQINIVLKNMQENPQYAMKAMKDPQIASAINKLAAAGILKVK